MAGRRVLLLVIVGLLLGCATRAGSAAPPIPATPSSRPSPGGSVPSESNDRTAGWQSDIEGIVPAIDRLHPRIDHGTPRTELEAAATTLADSVPGAADDVLLAGIMRIVAAISASGCDAHTGVYAWSAGSRFPVRSLPLRLWLFGDEVRIVDAMPQGGDLIGARIDAIGGHPIADVVRAVDPLVPRDNPETVRLLLPRFLLMPEVLAGLELVDPAGAVDLTLTRSDGTLVSRSLEPIAIAEYNDWAGAYGLHLPADLAVPYLARIDDVLWWTARNDGTLVVQLNRIEPLGTSRLAELRAALTAPGVAKVVLDLRHDFGGEVPALANIMDAFADPGVDRPGRLFVVTGRNTFSAASLLVARLAERTSARIVGEPMGGCPTAYGDADEIRLPYSGIAVSVARRLEIGVAADDTRLTIEPGLPAPLSFEGWQAGRDPALEAIEAAGS